MFTQIAKKFFGSANERLIASYRKTVDEINSFEADLQTLSDGQIAHKTTQFKDRLAAGETLDHILPEAFAVCREASRRILGMRHFDVQMIGGIILHTGQIAEMRTGEGKTLVATLPVYLNALTGKGVHVVTVNDYLARRDAAWMGRLYNFLGLSVGVIVPGIKDDERRRSYACDITYGTNNELGFDYLRDNMKHELDEMVQREFHYAIVDEVDSILIDEARTPLIISGPAEDSSDLYRKVDKIIPLLKPEDMEIDEKARTASLSEKGSERIEELLTEAGYLTAGSLYDLHNMTLLHHVQQSLRAHKMFAKDKDYIVKDGKVIIIDEFTGRMMDGRRYGEGLHQALEAKEDVKIQVENQTLATITFQNFFRLYPRLSGMTGTAMTEAEEFGQIYGLHVVEVPTNRPMSRIDMDDEIYRTMEQKYQAILMIIEDCQARQQPVLVGTVSIEKSEQLSEVLKKKKIKHQVLNAKFHEQEAQIVAEAGRPGAVTIATNMAGRGTDIQLGGNFNVRLAQAAGDVTDAAKIEKIKEKVAVELEQDAVTVREAGGLYIIGTERHESRRIDNQLRGRSGRQGDPGKSKFFLSLEDDLMRIFGGDKLEGFLRSMNVDKDEVITHPWISKAIEKAQKRVEARNFDIRKNLLKFDDVMNDQRKAIYEQRREIMRSDDLLVMMDDMRMEVVDEIIAMTIPPHSYPEQWDMATMDAEMKRIFKLAIPGQDWSAENGVDADVIRQRLLAGTEQQLKHQFSAFPDVILHSTLKTLSLTMLDLEWKEHLLALDHLRQGISLRAYGQKDPLHEYKREAFGLFATMLAQVRDKVMQGASSLDEQLARLREFSARQEARRSVEIHASMDEPKTKKPVVKKAATKIDPSNPETWGKVGRNDACPCGSGKKYKSCHGKG